MTRWAFRLGGIVAIALGACSGPSVLVVGEAVRPLEPPPPVFQVSIVADDDLTPLPAALRADDADLMADLAGRVTLTWLEQPIAITASVPGFHPASITIDIFPEEGPVELRLTPVVLAGTVTAADGTPLPETMVALGDQTTRTGGNGQFRFIRAISGSLDVIRPAWEPATVDWNGTTESISVELEPRMVRALRVQARKTGNPTEWQKLLDLADATEVNAFVIDTKDERGNVYHNTSVATAHEIGAVQAIYDLDQVLADMDEHGLYKITRIVTFQDPWLAPSRPSIAIRNTTTNEPWETNSGRAWLDPTDPDAWEYPLALAVEACERGFDEIQFDYVRFPSDGPISQVSFDELEYGSRTEYYSEPSQTIRVDTIAAFLTEAHDRLHPMGCAVAADIFSITLESRNDEGIGQLPGPFASAVDVLSPMIYSYAYPDGWKGCPDTDECAPEIVDAALRGGFTKLEAADGFGIYRPWLQRNRLESTEILEVQGVAESYDLGWMIWSENSVFDASMFDPAPAE